VLGKPIQRSHSNGRCVRFLVDFDRFDRCEGFQCRAYSARARRAAGLLDDELDLRQVP
jgi:hypothetical protein